MEIVVVSGGSSGIGQACVGKFLKHGTYKVYNLDIKEDPNAWEYDSNNYCWIKANMENNTEIQNAVEKILQDSGKVDIAILSAGKHLSANIENTTEEKLQEVLNLNLLGAFWLIKSLIPSMKSKARGNIITIGSDQSTIAKPNSTIYGMTKAALASLTRSIALDYAKYNIRANCIAAGTIDTPLYRNAIINHAKRSGIPLTQIENEEALKQPIGRVGTPEEVAELAFFLAQEYASYITGAILPIDGGYTVR